MKNTETKKNLSLFFVLVPMLFGKNQRYYIDNTTKNTKTY